MGSQRGDRTYCSQLKTSLLMQEGISHRKSNQNKLFTCLKNILGWPQREMGEVWRPQGTHGIFIIENLKLRHNLGLEDMLLMIMLSQYHHRMRSPPRYGPPPMDRRTDYPVRSKSDSPFHCWWQISHFTTWPESILLLIANYPYLYCRTTCVVSPTSHPLPTTVTPTTIPTLPHTPGFQDFSSKWNLNENTWFLDTTRVHRQLTGEERRVGAGELWFWLWHQFDFVFAAGLIITERWRSSCAGLQIGRVKGESRIIAIRAMPCWKLWISYVCH